MVFIFSGVVASMVFSAIIDKYQCYGVMMRVLSLGTVIAGCCGFFSLPSENLGILIANIVGLGATIIPIISISYSFAIELTYPVSEPMSNGIMVFMSQVVATCLSAGGTFVVNIPDHGALLALGLFTVLFIISFIASLFIK